MVGCDLAKQKVKEYIQSNEEGGHLEGESDAGYSEKPERSLGGDAVHDGNGDGFPLKGITEVPLFDEGGNVGDGSREETAVMELPLSPEADVIHASHTELDTRPPCDYTEGEDMASAEEEEGEEDYVPDGLDWSAEESSDYSSVDEEDEGSEGEAMEEESEGERRLAGKEKNTTSVMKGRPRKRLPKHLDDGDVSLYQARVR